MTALGMRVTNARYQKNSRKVKQGRETFIVESIVGCRYYEGVYEYEVLWEGYEESSYIDADKLNCIDLIEEFEKGLDGN